MIMMFLSSAQAATPNTILDMQISQQKTHSSIIFSENTTTHPHVFMLPNPERLVVDFSNSVLRFNVKALHIQHPYILKARSGMPKPEVVRFVFDLKMPVKYKIQYLDKKIILELSPSETLSKNISTSNTKSMVVVIDPGHGGKDAGAVGQLGTKEKDIVLSIAKQLAAMINQQPHMRAVLTRDDDYFISLHERLVSARKGKADLFVAIHADSYFNKQANGASIYALSAHGATSIAARWLARRDNYSELGGVDLGDLEDQSYLLRSVLIDLAQTTTTRDSMRLGASLLDSLDDVARLHYNRVEQAPFMVLKSPDIPSILVETGFISNSKEELRLRDKSYQRKIATALLNGIIHYQNKYAIASMS